MNRHRVAATKMLPYLGSRLVYVAISLKPVHSQRPLQSYLRSQLLIMEVTKAATSSHPVTSLVSTPFAIHWADNPEHDVVLDYITTHAFASTAKILSRPRSYAFTSTKGLSDELSMDDTGEGSSSREAEKRPKRARDQVLDQDSLQSIERRRGTCRQKRWS